MAKKVRTDIPAEVERLVKVQAGFRCSMPQCANMVGLEIHHIDEDPSNHDPDNLLVLCAVCHARVTNKEIDRKACQLIKQIVAAQSPGATQLTKDDLERAKVDIVAEMEKLVGRQQSPKPFIEEDKGKDEPDPRVEAAAVQADIFDRAGISLPIDVLRALGAKLYESGDLEQSLAVHTAMSSFEGMSPADYSNLGVLLDELDRKQEAEEAYRKAIEADPKLAQAWYNLGNLLDELDRKEEAEEVYRKAIDINPKYSSAWYNLGVLLKKLDRKQEAEEAYRKALEADPKLVQAWCNLGILLKELDRKQAAEEAYRKALEADPKYVSAWCNLGVLLSELDRKEEAEAAYRKALDIDLKLAPAWCNLGVLLNELDRKQEAEKAYKKALEARPGDADCCNSIAYSLWYIGCNDDAEEIVMRALEADPAHSYANATLGLLLFEKDQLSQGRNYYEKAIEIRPDDLPLQQKFHYEYGRALARNGCPSQARAELEAAKQIDSSHVPPADIEAELAKLESIG